MKNKNLLIIVILLALVLIGGYFWFAQTNQEVDQPVDNNGVVDENVDENIDEDVDEDATDGVDIVAENGAFTPDTLGVFPGQEMRVRNNENSDLFLVFREAEIGPIPAGGEGTFRAPMEAGSFDYMSSLDESVIFTLIVEI